MIDEIIKYFPYKLRDEVSKVVCNNIREIRIRVSKKVSIISDSNELAINYIPTLDDVLSILVNISKNSIYAIQNDINNGFIVVPRRAQNWYLWGGCYS